MNTGTRLLCTTDGVCVIVVWGGVLLFILRSSLDGVGPVRGLRGGRKRGVV